LASGHGKSREQAATGALGEREGPSGRATLEAGMGIPGENHLLSLAWL